MMGHATDFKLKRRIIRAVMELEPPRLSPFKILPFWKAVRETLSMVLHPYQYAWQVMQLTKARIISEIEEVEI